MQFNVWCHEPKGKVCRRVRRVTVSLPIVNYLYKQIQDVPNFITKDHRNMTRNSMCWLELPGTEVYLVDSVGAIVVLPVTPLNFAHVHITFWDKRLRGREDLCRELSWRVMLQSGYKALFTVIPKDSNAVLRFAERVGFDTIAEDETNFTLVLADRAHGLIAPCN